MKRRILALCLELCLLAVCVLGAQKISSLAAEPLPLGLSGPLAAEPAEEIRLALALLERHDLSRPVDAAFLDWASANTAPGFPTALAARLTSDGGSGEPFYDVCGQTLHVLWDRYTGAAEDNPRILDNGAAGAVTLAFAGDVNLADDWENMQAFNNQPDGVEGVISAPLLSRLQEADILMVNNEFCFSDRGAPTAGKRYTFRAATENVALLHELGVDIVSLANNHVFDYGVEAFADTLDTLRAAGIPAVGAGRNLDEAMQIQYFHAGGMKIAYVAASRSEKYMHTPPATTSEAGVLPCYEGESLLETVAAARANADWVVVYPHWGTEYATTLEAEQVSLAHALVDSGADMVVGAHPHVLQGIELYKGKPIAYSLGNFWFNVGWVKTALLEVELTAPGEYRLRVAPCMTAQGTVSLLEEESERRALFKHLEGLSGGIRIEDDGAVVPAGQEK